ncbi:NAD+ synthase [Coriobacteriia bacterium Es71-Z0120]|uniref:NAD+ synthase n=1 Tax=Parvivirga hydrogeniphila TaxID=2939460 RepID=UPI002260897A|nr:NAD+ synthase [Parvivirga hydrogeniphila]MCL4078833.1 NAD+ synthase [Parvivirga hydrogeniphila]
MRFALAQVNPTVGDIDGNLVLALEAAREAAEAGAELVVLPELVITGYPPEDLLAKPHFVERAMAAVETFAAEAACSALIGTPWQEGGALYNAAVHTASGAIRDVYRKRLLPNYGVFDEKRYFTPGNANVLLALDGTGVGVTICEDAWQPEPIARLASIGAKAVVNLSASPFYAGKGVSRERMLVRRALEFGVWVVYCNLVGGQDELVFDGRSVVIAPDGTVVGRARSFDEDLLVVDVDDKQPRPQRVEPRIEHEAEMYAALTLGLRDYIHKNGFTDVVLGLSGGIDSALVATLAADALGPERVHGVMMPSRYSSESSLADARALADALGIDVLELGIEPTFTAALDTLAPVFAGAAPDVTEENLQARVRGMLLMALSNKFGWLVLATGNKSELSVGYSTLYGDMVGGFAPIKDVFKTRVYELARWRNTRSPAIPDSTLTKPPSAELRPGQTDQDTLPPYEVLDAILVEYVELDRSVDEIVAMGHDRETVERVAAMVDGAEYKRRQGPVGIKVTPKAFGKDRRMPITNRFRG